MRSFLHRWRLARALDDGWPLPPATATRLERDPDLRARRDALQRVDRRLRSDVARARVEPPERLRGRIFDALRGADSSGLADPPDRARRRAQRWRAAWPVAAGLAAALALALFAGTRVREGASGPGAGEQPRVVEASPKTPPSGPARRAGSESGGFSVHVFAGPGPDLFAAVDLPLLSEVLHLRDDAARTAAAFADRVPLARIERRR
jgi:hypothetical protein